MNKQTIYKIESTFDSTFSNMKKKDISKLTSYTQENKAFKNARRLRKKYGEIIKLYVITYTYNMFDSIPAIETKEELY